MFLELLEPDAGTSSVLTIYASQIESISGADQQHEPDGSSLFMQLADFAQKHSDGTREGLAEFIQVLIIIVSRDSDGELRNKFIPLARCTGLVHWQ